MTESNSMKVLIPISEIKNKIINLVESKMSFDFSSSQDMAEILSLAKKQHPMVEHLIDHITALFPKIMAAIEERKLSVTNGYLTILQSVEQKRNIITTRISGALSGTFLRPRNHHDNNNIITVSPISIRPATAQDTESWFLTAELVTTSSKFSSYVPLLSCLLGLGGGVSSTVSTQPPPVVCVQAKLVEVVSSQVSHTTVHNSLPTFPPYCLPPRYPTSPDRTSLSSHPIVCHVRVKRATDIPALMSSKRIPWDP